MTSYRSEDRTLPAVVYGLYLVGLLTLLPILIGLVIAYANRPGAGPETESHYVFQIRSFWLAIAWWIIGAIFIFWGIPLSLILIGVPLLMIGGAILALVHIWFGLRAVLGLVHLARREGYPRPRA